MAYFESLRCIMSFYRLSSPVKLLTQFCYRQKKSLAEFSSFSLNFKPVEANLSQVADFQRMFEMQTILPSFVFVQAFPYIVQTLVKSAIPSRLIGLVHLSAHITQHSRHDFSRPSEIEVTMAKAENTEKGIAYHVVCQFMQQGKKTLMNENVFLAKANIKSQSKVGMLTNLDDGRSSQIIADHKVTAELAWQYAKLSKDFNPIHINPWLAKLLGMKTSLIHGMYNCHWALSRLSSDMLASSDVIRVEFKRPCFLPSDIVLIDKGENQFAIYSQDLKNLHLNIFCQ